MYLGSHYTRWCDSCSVPILEALECPSCGTRTKALRLSPPCELKPAFDDEISLIRYFLDEMYGRNSGQKVLPNSPVLLNDRSGNSKAYDRNYEIIIGGNKIGILRFDVSSMNWTFVPLIHLGDSFENLTKKTLRLRGEFSLSLMNGHNIKGVELDHSLDVNQIFIKSGPVVALGRVEEQNENGKTKTSTIRVRTSKIISNRKYKNIPWLKVARINEKFLIEKEKESIIFLRKLRDKYDLPITVGFSGGKDSTALLLLAKKALGNDFSVLYVDTGIEFPEAREYVTQIVKMLGLTSILHVVKPENSFWHYSKTFGVPARDYRWCCKVLKFGPISKYVQSNFTSGTITLIGTRKYESKKRQIANKVEANRWLRGQILASPLRDWSSLHVWLYLFFNRIPMNPVYHIGINRLSCWVCPGLKLAELHQLKLKHPELHLKLTNYLRAWGQTYGFDEDWIVKGLWRESNPTKPKSKSRRKRERVTAVYSKRRSPILTNASGFSFSSDSSYTITMTLNDLPEISRIYLALTPYEPKLLRNNTVLLSLDRGTIRIGNNGIVQIRSETKESAERILKGKLKQVIRSSYCVGCGLCVPPCPTKARRIVNGRLVVSDHCTKCYLCEEVKCPISMILQERKYSWRNRLD